MSPNFASKVIVIKAREDILNKVLLMISILLSGAINLSAHEINIPGVQILNLEDKNPAEQIVAEISLLLGLDSSKFKIEYTENSYNCFANNSHWKSSSE